MSILYLRYDKFYILWVVLTLYGLTERIMNECMKILSRKKRMLCIVCMSLNISVYELVCLHDDD